MHIVSLAGGCVCLPRSTCSLLQVQVSRTSSMKALKIEARATYLIVVCSWLAVDSCFHSSTLLCAVGVVCRKNNAVNMMTVFDEMLQAPSFV